MKGRGERLWLLLLLMVLLCGRTDMASASGKLRHVEGEWQSADAEKIDVPVLKGDLFWQSYMDKNPSDPYAVYWLAIDRTEDASYTVPVTVKEDGLLCMEIQLQVDGKLQAVLTKDEAGSKVIYRFGKKTAMQPSEASGDEAICFQELKEYLPITSGDYYLHFTASDVRQEVKKIPVSLSIFSCAAMKDPICIAPMLEDLNYDIKLIATVKNGKEDIYRFELKKEACFVPMAMPYDEYRGDGYSDAVDFPQFKAAVYNSGQKKLSPVYQYDEISCYALKKGSYELHIEASDPIYLMLCASAFTSKTSDSKKGAQAIKKYPISVGYFDKEDKKNKTYYYKVGKKDKPEDFEILYFGKGKLRVTVHYADGSKESSLYEGEGEITPDLDSKKRKKGACYISVKNEKKAKGIFAVMTQ